MRYQYPSIPDLENRKFSIKHCFYLSISWEGTDLRVLPCVLTNPTQQDLFTVSLLKARHHILHHILYLHVHIRDHQKRFFSHWACVLCTFFCYFRYLNCLNSVEILHLENCFFKHAITKVWSNLPILR